MDDIQLLRRYATDDDERAFDRIVERYYPLVHRAAYARTGDDQLSDDVATAVFLLLADRAHSLSPNVVLAGWLFKTARLSACNAVRDEKRRRKREAEVVKMAEEAVAASTGPPDVAVLATIDEGLMKLSEQDRNAVLLRYAQGLSIKEAAVALRVNPDTAQKRSVRGLERLRRICQQGGSALTVAAIAAALGEKSAHAAPASFGVAAARQAIHVVSRSNIEILYKGAAIQMIRAKIMTMVGAVAATAIIAGSVYVATHASGQHMPPTQGTITKPALAISSASTGPGSPRDVAEAFFTAIANGKPDEAYSMLCGLTYPTVVNDPKLLARISLVRHELQVYADSGLTIVSLGEATTDSRYPDDVYVPYKIKFKDGYAKTFRLAVRVDEMTHKWAVDGGF